MKPILPYLLLLTGLPALAQKKTTVKIIITTEHIRRHDANSLISDSIQFYKLPGNILAFTVPSKKISNSFELTDIPVGTYEVKYRRNMFMDTTTRQITLINQPLNEISLCADSLDGYPQNTLARLQDKDSIVIRFESSSCDGFDVSKCIITRDKDHFVASMYRSFEDHQGLLERASQPPKEPELRSVVLTDQQIKAFVRFENELLQIKPFLEETTVNNKVVFSIEHITTTTDDYTVKSKYFNIGKKDKWCKWNGFNWLATALFGSSY